MCSPLCLNTRNAASRSSQRYLFQSRSTSDNSVGCADGLYEPQMRTVQVAIKVKQQAARDGKQSGGCGASQDLACELSPAAASPLPKALLWIVVTKWVLSILRQWHL